MIHIFSNVYVCEFAPFTVGVGFARFGVMCMWLVWMSTQQTTLKESEPRADGGSE